MDINQTCIDTLIKLGSAYKPMSKSDVRIIFWSSYLGDNCIQNFHLGRYIVGYTVGNLVLAFWRIIGDVTKSDWTKKRVHIIMKFRI